jgi:hypothetical protein
MPPEQSPKAKPLDDLKRLRTYEGDVEEMLQKQQVSKATIALAENEREIKRETVAAKPSSPLPTAPSKVFRISSGLPLRAHWNVRLISLVIFGLISIGVVGVGAFFFFKNTKPQVVAPKKEVSETAAVKLPIGVVGARAIIAIRDSMQAISVPQNETRIVPITLGGSVIGTPQLFEMLAITPPPTLTRALGTMPIFGLHGFRGGQLFLLFDVLSYDYAFSGMLSFEGTVLESIGPLFGVNVREILKNVGSTTTQALRNRIVFKDVIIRNKDARVALDPNGVIIFLYSFINKQTLVLTTNVDTLKTLITEVDGRGRLR